MTLERRIQALEKIAPPPPPPARKRDPAGAQWLLAAMLLLGSSGGWKRHKRCDCTGEGHFCHAAREKDAWADALHYASHNELRFARRFFPKLVDIRLRAAFAAMLKKAGATTLTMAAAETLFAGTPASLRRHMRITDLEEFRGELE